MPDPLTCQAINCELPSDYSYNEQAIPPTPPPEPTPPISPLLPWNYLACNGINFDAPVEDAGGDTFDCYPDGDVADFPTIPGYEQATLIGGNGFTGAWRFDDSPFNAPVGDTFEEYPDGTVTGGTLDGGTGYDDPWASD